MQKWTMIDNQRRGFTLPLLYAKSKEDEERFLKMQEKLAENLKDDTFVYGKALECLDKALDVYRTFLVEEKKLPCLCGRDSYKRCLTVPLKIGILILVSKVSM